MKKKQNVNGLLLAKALRRGTNYDRIALEHDTTKNEIFKLMLKNGFTPVELQ